jgi:hypothetical protein
MRTTSQMVPNSRRKASRVATSEVRVFWNCGDRHDVLNVMNLSFGGIFVKTHKSQDVGAKAQMDFLVEEGQSEPRQLCVMFGTRRVWASNSLQLLRKIDPVWPRC